MSEREPPKRAIALAVAVVVSVGLVTLALVLGHWARRTRSALLHQGRLERLLEKKPHQDQVAAGLEQEGTHEVGRAASGPELVVLATRWGGPRRDAIVAEGRRWATTRAFASGPIVYFIYFDAHGTMKGFTLVA